MTIVATHSRALAAMDDHAARRAHPEGISCSPAWVNLSPLTEASLDHNAASCALAVSGDLAPDNAADIGRDSFGCNKVLSSRHCEETRFQGETGLVLK